jgi:hypothetical protein
MWITIAALIMATVLWTFLVRRIARSRGKAFVNSVRALNESLDREVETLSRLDRSLADWTATMDQAAKKLQARGRRPSPAPDHDALGPSDREHRAHDKSERISQAMNWDLSETSGKHSRRLIRLIRNWRNPEPRYTRLKGWMARDYAAGYISGYPDDLIALHFQHYIGSHERFKAVRLVKAVHFAREGIVDLDSAIFTMEPKSLGIEMMSIASPPGISVTAKGWVTALEENAIRIHGGFGTGKSYWVASSYLSGEEPDPKVIGLRAVEGLASLPQH